MTSEEIQYEPRKLSVQRVVCALVGIVFVAAAILKAIRPEDFLEAIRISFSLDPRAALAIGATVVALEMSVGMALFIKNFRRFSSFAAIALLAAFTAYLVGFHSPDAPSCGCLGVASSSPVGSSMTLGVARNLAMLTGLALCTPFRGTPNTSKEINNVRWNDS